MATNFLARVRENENVSFVIRFAQYIELPASNFPAFSTRTISYLMRIKLTTQQNGVKNSRESEGARERQRARISHYLKSTPAVLL